MLRNSAGFVMAAAISAITLMTQPTYGLSSNVTSFKPPTLIPFLHIDLRVVASTYVTTTNGVLTGQANNQGGKRLFFLLRK